MTKKIVANYTFANRFFQAQGQHLSDGVLRLGVHLRWTKLLCVLDVQNKLIRQKQI